MDHRDIGVAGLAGDPAIPAHQPPLPHVPMGRMGETMGRGFNKLGWHWWPSDSAIATRPHNGRGQCLNLGPCNAGCAQGAKIAGHESTRTTRLYNRLPDEVSLVEIERIHI